MFSLCLTTDAAVNMLPADDPPSKTHDPLRIQWFNHLNIDHVWSLENVWAVRHIKFQFGQISFFGRKYA